MSTINDFNKGKTAVSTQNCFVVKSEVEVDFSSDVVAISGDVVQTVKIPAGAIVTKVGVNVITGEAGIVDVGDGSNPDGWLVDVDLSSTGMLFDVDALYPTLGGKYYATADTIDLTLAVTQDSGKVNVFAIYIQSENV